MASATLRGASGVPIEYELVQQKTGPPFGTPSTLVVFLSGLGNHRTLWLRQKEYFERSHPTFTLLFVDNHGVSGSGLPAGTYALYLMAADVLHLLSALVPAWTDQSTWSTHLVAHSMGALIGYEMLHRAPRGSFASVALLSVTLAFGCLSRPICQIKWTGLLKMVGMLTATTMPEILQASLELNYPAAWSAAPAEDGGDGINADAVMRFLRRALSGRRPIGAATWSKQASAFVSYVAPDSRQLEGSRTRVLVVGGDADALVPVHGLRSTAQRLGGRTTK